METSQDMLSRYLMEDTDLECKVLWFLMFLIPHICRYVLNFLVDHDNCHSEICYIEDGYFCPT